jgi:eukaryotic-like serine/threonine-protein kinase
MVGALGHYKILERIGTGGLGDLFRARDTRVGRTVAIATAPPGATDAEHREQFLADARAATALSHPNIASLYEVGEDQGQLFLVSEFVAGESLKAAIAGRPLNARRAIDLAAQLADALADAHAMAIVHGDIKPETIVVTPRGNAKILDFGLAAWTTGGAERRRAAQTMAAGAATVEGPIAYMSPEQALGEAVDHRTDIFSLGVVLFEMLTGTQPFSGPTPAALALQVLQATAPEPSTLNKALPREVDAIVAKALAKSLDRRYESAAALSADLRAVGAILDARSEAAQASSPPLVRRRKRRSAAPWIVLIVLALLAAAIWFERDLLMQLLSR